MKVHEYNVRNASLRVALLAVLALAITGPVRANPGITVWWDCQGTPEDPRDYHVDYTNPSYPDVELYTECLYWKVKSVDGESPGDIGEITATDAYNYGLSITDGSGGPGAREVKGINLDPQGEGSDANYSNLTDGRITGNLTGDLFVQESSGGQGGTASFSIYGNAGGNITIPTALSLSIGTVSGSTEIGVVDGSLSITELTGTGSVVVTDKIDSGTLSVSGYVAPNADVVIADMVGTVLVTFSHLGDFAGNLVLESGLKLYQLLEIHGTLASTASVDLGPEVAYNVNILGGGVSGSTVSGGTIKDTAVVALAGWDKTFAGQATFGSVAGTVKMCPGYLDGPIIVAGDVDGAIAITHHPTSGIGGDLLSNGVIQIGDELAGSVTVGRDALGDIDIGGDITSTGHVLIGGDITSTGHVAVLNNFSGDLTVSGDAGGEISIGGNAYGTVDLEEFTGSLSVTGDVDFEWLIVWGSGSGDITGGAVTSPLVVLASGAGNAYSGTATFSSVAGSALVQTWLASLSGTIHVTGNVPGTVDAHGDASNPGLTGTGLIDIDGNVSGDVEVSGDALGDINIWKLTGSLSIDGHAQGHTRIPKVWFLSIVENLSGDVETHPFKCTVV